MEKYKNTEVGFEEFNRNTFNMPRDEFGNLTLFKIRYLSAYLLLIENDCNKNEEINYKEIMNKMRNAINKGGKPLIIDREFEKNYLTFENLDDQYKVNGRQFRHLMGQCKLFKILKNTSSKKVLIDFDRCKELVRSEDDILNSVIRNNILEINVKDNPFFRSLKSIEDSVIKHQISVDYPIAQTIIEYIHEIKRPVTKLEVSFLLARIDDLYTKDEILHNALIIGQRLPRTFEEQKDYFFNMMNWYKDSGDGIKRKFIYKSSSEPWFKFRTFIIWMISFGLLTEDEKGMLNLTDYSLNIIESELNPYLVDLERLLEQLEENNVKESEIIDVIIKSRHEELTNFLLENKQLIELVSKRSLNKRKKDQYEEKDKRHKEKSKRNNLVMVFSKVMRNHKCDIIYSLDSNGLPKFEFNKMLFENGDGLGYCEGHHIIEFGRENGPDIIENIVLVDPNTHMLIHHGHPTLKRDLYAIMRQQKIVTFKTFSDMIEKYNCLTEEHINIIYNKGLIYFNEKPKLIEKIKNKKHTEL